jgi:hypothetical protein
LSKVRLLVVMASAVWARGKSMQALPPNASWPRTWGREGRRDQKKRRRGMEVNKYADRSKGRRERGREGGKGRRNEGPGRDGGWDESL